MDVDEVYISLKPNKAVNQLLFIAKNKFTSLTLTNSTEQNRSVCFSKHLLINS